MNNAWHLNGDHENKRVPGHLSGFQISYNTSARQKIGESLLFLGYCRMRTADKATLLPWGFPVIIIVIRIVYHRHRNSLPFCYGS